MTKEIKHTNEIIETAMGNPVVFCSMTGAVTSRNIKWSEGVPLDINLINLSEFEKDFLGYSEADGTSATKKYYQFKNINVILENVKLLKKICAVYLVGITIEEIGIGKMHVSASFKTDSTLTGGNATTYFDQYNQDNPSISISFFHETNLLLESFNFGNYVIACGNNNRIVTEKKQITTWNLDSYANYITYTIDNACFYNCARVPR